MTDKENNLTVNLALLKELANRNIRHNVSKKIESIVESLYDRQDYAHYHYHTFKNIISKVDTDLAKFKMAFNMSDDDIRNKTAIQANIFACMQSIHITHDILAYLIATILNLELSEREITFQKVQKKVNIFENLKNLMNAFSNHDDYRYLISYVNHAKHRYHIEPKITYYFVGEKHHTAEFEEFEFKGNQYQKQNVEEFLFREYNREQKLILQIENELINILQIDQGQN